MTLAALMAVTWMAWFGVTPAPAAVATRLPAPRGSASSRAPGRGAVTADPDSAIHRLLEWHHYAAAESAAVAGYRAALAAGDSLAVAAALNLRIETAFETRDNLDSLWTTWAARAARIQRSPSAATDPEIARTIRNQALLKHRAQEDSLAEIMLERVVAMRSKSLGPDHPSVASAYVDLGDVASARRNLKAARERYERAVAIREKSLGPNHPELGRALLSVGTAASDFGDAPAARAADERALKILESSLGSDHPDVASALVDLAIVVGDNGDDQTAGRYFTRALEIRERAFGRESREAGETLVLLARTEYYLGHVLESKAMFERALAIARALHGEDHPSVATGLNNLALIEQHLGDFQEARRLLERSLAIQEKSGDPNDPELGFILTNLGNSLSAAGEYAEARGYLERTVRLWESYQGGTYVNLPAGIANLATLELETGDYDVAARLLERARSLYEKQGGPQTPYVSRVLEMLSETDRRGGNFAAARSFAEQALRISEKLYGPDSSAMGWSHLRLAEALRAVGAAAEARPQYERAISDLQKSLGPDHPSLTQPLTGLASLDEDLGHPAAALHHLDRVLAIDQKAMGPDHIAVVDTQGRRARLLGRLGHFDEAWTLALRSEQMGRDFRRLAMRSMPERKALLFSSVGTPALHVAFAIAARSLLHPDTLAQLWDAEIRSRSMVLDVMAARQREVLAAHDSATRARLAAVSEARQRLANLTLRGPSSDSPTTYGTLLADAREATDRAERALAESGSGATEHPAHPEAGYEAVMRARPAASALVSFVRYEDDLEMRADSTHGPTVARYVALVRNGNLAPALVPLGRASEIDSLVAAWRSEAAHYPESLVRKLRDAEYRRVGSALRERTWDALQPALRGARQVFIVGDGALCLVHWGTLPEPDGRYLIESPLLIHSLVAERDLLLQADPAPTGGLLALGDPDFDRAGVEVAVRPTTVALRGQRSNCVAFRSRRWTALPATSLEVRDVLARWRKSSRRANASGAAEYGAADTVLTGDRATEAAFKQLAAGHRVLHLATHGFFVEGECASSGSTNREGDFDRRNGALEPRRIAVENPLLLSGLVLAGANRRDSTAINADDGVLTAEEVAALDLRGVEWAVLSACETGLGELRPGEGVFGLRRAFEIAGARTVIMSLWPVDDAKTREWMAELYRARFEKGVSTGEAVRAAALAMLHRQRAHEGTTHPANWGAFVSAGDWK